jgi:Flp pilus assembly protein TadD
MNGKTARSGKMTAWPAIFVGGLVGLISLVHLPSCLDVLNYFDPPKRLFWALLALILAGAWRIQKSRLDRTPLLLSLGLLAWMVVRTLLKPRPDVELEVLFTWMLPLLFIILASGLDGERWGRVFGGWLVMACLIQASLMVLQRWGFDPLFSDTTSAMEYKPERMVGTIGYQNQAVDFLALSSAGVFLISRSLGLRLAFMTGMLWVAGLTGNRGGIVAFTAALLISQLFPTGIRDAWSRRKKWMAAAILALGICGVWGSLALIPDTGSRLREVMTDFNHSPAVNSRLSMARVGGNLFLEKPWVGWGAGEYAFQYLDRLGDILPEEKTHELLRNLVFAREAHNDLLQFAVEFGVVGVLLVTVLLGIAVVRVSRARRVCGAAGPAFAFILTYMAVSGLFSFPWQTSMGGPLAGLWLGWLWPKGSESGRERMKARGGMPQWAWSCAAQSALVVLALVLTGWFALDAFLNLDVPKTLAKDGPVAAEQRLPRCAYRYHALVGAAYASQSAYREAEKELLHAQLGYRDIPLWNNLGHVQGKMGKWNEAWQVYARWARCGLNYADALSNLSIAYEQAGRPKEAADILARHTALWRDPSLKEIKRLSVLQFQSGQPQAAQETLLRSRGKWMASDPKTKAEFENLAGGICLALGSKPEAERWFRLALDLNPDLESARRNLEELSKDSAGEPTVGGPAGEE